MRRAGALILKGFRLATTYRLNFVGRQAVWFFVVFWIYFMGEVFVPNPEVKALLGDVDVFTFMLVGICFQQFLLTFLMSFANNLREEMLMGTLEPLLATPGREQTVLLCGSIWNFAEALWTATVMITLGWLFGAQFSPNVVGVLAVVVLSMVGLAAWGIVSASFVMVFKKADPVGWGIYAVSYLLCGVYYPVEVLPNWLRYVSYLHPLTYGVQGVRNTLVHGRSLWDGQGLDWGTLPTLLAQGPSHWPMPLMVAALVVYAAVLVPLSLVCFRLAVRRARTTGSLVHY